MGIQVIMDEEATMVTVTITMIMTGMISVLRFVPDISHSHPELKKSGER